MLRRHPGPAFHLPNSAATKPSTLSSPLKNGQRESPVERVTCRCIPVIHPSGFLFSLPIRCIPRQGWFFRADHESDSGLTSKPTVPLPYDPNLDAQGSHYEFQGMRLHHVLRQ